MAILPFSVLCITVKDLPPRAIAMSEDEAWEVLGGGMFTPGSVLAKFKAARDKLHKKVKATAARKPVKRPVRRRSRRSYYMRKAAFHSRLAARNRRMASRYG